MTLENGKPYEEAKKEVQFALGYFGWFAEEARRMTGEWIPSPQPSKRYWVLRQPIGPVAAVTPWNFPATMVTRKIAPALAAGCTVVLKPASATPLTALAIARITEVAGLPRGVFNVLTTNRSRLVGAELLTHPLIRKIGFTGSTDVGKGIMETAAKQVTRLSFELGGNAPFIVFDDADFKAALEGAVAMKFLRVGGQSCICANRIYVQRGIAGQVHSGIHRRGGEAEGRAGLRAGRSDRSADQRGDTRKGARAGRGRGQAWRQARRRRPLSDPRRLRQGLLLFARGPDRRHRRHGDRAGGDLRPAAPILVFDTEDEVIRRANATKFGLAAYFYTRDLARLIRVSEQLEYGLVGANDATGYTHEIPFGGFKESGLGREGGHEGIAEYTEVKSVVLNLG